MTTITLATIEGISIETKIEYDGQKYEIIEKTIDPTDLASVKQKKTDTNINIHRVNGYFKVKDRTTGKKTKKFDTPLVFKIKFTDVQWKEAVGNDTQKKYDRPRVAYLVWKKKNKKWADKWVEFKKKKMKVTYPGTNNDPNGYLEITVSKLKDPLIGGC